MFVFSFPHQRLPEQHRWKKADHREKPVGQKLQAHHLTQVQEFCLFFILFFCLKGKLSLRVRRPILPSVFFFQKRKVINGIATPPWIGCLSITQLPSFFPPPSPKKKNRLYQFILPGWRKAKWESKVSCPPTQPSDAALVWTETRSSRVPLTSRASRHILRNCSSVRSSKPADFVRFGEIYVLLTMQTINIAISNCSCYAHTQ